MIYLFRKFNKQLITATDVAAWEMYSSNGNWKHRPQYIGAVQEQDYHAIKEQVQEAFPISDDLYVQVNTGKNRKADRELGKIQEQRREATTALLEALAEKADKSVTPPNMDVVNKGTLQPHEKKALANLIGS